MSIPTGCWFLSFGEKLSRSAICPRTIPIHALLSFRVPSCFPIPSPLSLTPLSPASSISPLVFSSLSFLPSHFSSICLYWLLCFSLLSFCLVSVSVLCRTYTAGLPQVMWQGCAGGSLSGPVSDLSRQYFLLPPFPFVSFPCVCLISFLLLCVRNLFSPLFAVCPLSRVFLLSRPTISGPLLSPSRVERRAQLFKTPDIDTSQAAVQNNIGDGVFGKGKDSSAGKGGQSSRGDIYRIEGNANYCFSLF